VAEPEPVVADDDDAEESSGPEMASQEVLDSIRRTFERKSGIVGRCFVDGVDANEIKKTDRGFVTIVATITPSGSATEVRVTEASLRSKAVHTCIIDMVKGWTFAEPPRPTPTSFTYVLERL
jgi:hypothetical protein